MAQSWPSTLQDRFNTSGFSHEIGDTLLRSDTEYGSQKIRRRFTRGTDKQTGKIWVKGYTELQTLITFYNTTCAGGSLPFTFFNPITESNTTYRFTSSLKFNPVGNDVFEVDMSLEIVP